MLDTVVIIPVYATPENGRIQFLPPAINSLLRQSYPDFLCLVVDDGSPDKSVEAIVSNFMQSDSRLRYAYRERKPADKVTASNARNRGIEELLNPSGVLTDAEARQIQFLTFLDSDDLLPKESLEARVDYLKQNPGAGAVYSDSVFFKGTNIIRYLKASSAEGAALIKEAVGYCAFPPLTLIWRRSLVEEMRNLRSSNGKCEIFNPRITYEEDRDVAIFTLETALQKGYTVGYIGRNSYFYRANPCSVVNYTTSEQIKREDRMRLRKLHRGYGCFGPPKRILLKPYVLLPEPIKKVLRPVRNGLGAFIHYLIRAGEDYEELISLNPHQTSFGNS